MATSRITISVKNILQGGVTCTNPTIQAQLVNGLVMPCPIVDGKIELQLDGQGAGYCFDLIIDCEDCNTCPPQVKRICLCESNDDCPDCETCIDGICTPICPEDEFCDNGICKDCLVDGDCLCNKECVNGECTCPADKPYEVNGCCYECEEGQTDGNGCLVCTGGRFVEKDCGDFLLDPVTCQCKECIDSGDCLEPNTCCVDGSCECCPGYYYDPGAGSCIPIPPCFTEEDCPDCYTCLNGNCVEITCPAGYIRTGIAGNCCAKECDCDNPSCPSGMTCVEYENGSCYCKGCEGACVDSLDCGVGCGCYDGNCSKTPKGCDGPCYTSDDCGFGCGCLDNNCVDCKTLGCNNNDDCFRANGCDCKDGNCDKSDCADQCIDGADCAQGCGCEDNNCVKCSNVPCVNSEDCPEGCVCNGGICGTTDCDEIYCLNPGDCGEGCGCKDGRCIKCTTLDCGTTECDDTPGCSCNTGNCEGDPGDDCDDDLRIEKVSSAFTCKIRGILDLKNCCGCPDISFHATAVVAGSNLTYTGRLRKGLLTTSPLLGSTGISNELPISGIIKFIVIQEDIEVDGGGAPTGVTRNYTRSVTKDYTGVDTNTEVFTINPVGSTYTDSGKTWKVVNICTYVEGFTNILFDNECQYKAPDIRLQCHDFLTPSFAITPLTKVTRCKTPLFTWSKSADGITYSVFREVYSDRLDIDTYKDDIGVDEGVEVCKYYKLEVDCGCDKLTYYSCNGDGEVATKLVYCQPTDLEISVANCNQDLVIEEVQVCLAMIGASYDLYLNGVLYGSYTVNGSGILFAGTEVINSAEPIFEVKLVFDCDDCDDCTIIKTLEPIDDPCGCSGVLLSPSVNTTNACTTGITYTIAGGTGPYSVVLKKGASTIFSTTQATVGVYAYNSILANGTYTLTVTDVYGCEKTAGFIINACCLIVGSGLSYDCVTKTVAGTITASNGSGTYIVEIGTYPAFNEGAGAFTEVIDILDGTYNVKITDSVNGGCYWLGLLNVGCGGIDLDITSTCDTVDPTKSAVLLENPSGGTAPYLAEFYANLGTVSVDANGCPTNPAQLRSSTTTYPATIGGATYNQNWQFVVKLTDALGRTRCFPAQNFINCADNGFTFTTRFYCDGATKKICVTPSVTGTYEITIGGGAPFNETFVAGQEKCYTTVLANGTHAVTMENGSGVLISKNVVVTTCNDYSVSYDCTNGLEILENGIAWTGTIRVDGQPGSGYINYTGPGTVFLADTTPDHVIGIYVGGVLMNTTEVLNINCCELTLTNLTFLCEPGVGEGTIEFDIVNIVNPTGTHSILVKQGVTVVQSEPAYASSHFTSNVLPNGSYTVEVTDDTYNVPNAGVGSGQTCDVTRTIEIACVEPCGIDDVDAVFKGEIDCADNGKIGHWRVKAINNELISLNYEIWRKPYTVLGLCPNPGVLCSTSGYTKLDDGVVPASSTACYDFASADNTACFLVKFIDPSDSSCYKCLKADFELL